MRKPKRIKHADGQVRWRVRYRSAGRETSETFVRKDDADTFAAIMGDGRSPARVADALAWLAARQAEAEVETFAAWFDAYIEQLTGVTERTKHDYHAIHRRYLTSLDLLPLPLITRAHVASIVNDLDKRGLSHKTIKNAVQMLASVMAAALEEGHITRNPVKKIRLPDRKADKHEPKYLTAAEFRSLLAALPEHYQPFVAFLVGTGLRWSEATALQSRDVDLDNGTVRVRRAWKRVPGGWEVGAPKSDKSRRTVNAAVIALAAAAPLLGKPDELVFTTPRGNVIRHANFYNRVWKPACEAAGIDAGPHTTRHTFASWMLSEGQPVEAVQDQLGHESVETTRRIYAHLLPAVGVEAGRAASEALRRALDSPETRGLLEFWGGQSRGGADQTHHALGVAAGMDDDRDR